MNTIPLSKGINRFLALAVALLIWGLSLLVLIKSFSWLSLIVALFAAALVSLYCVLMFQSRLVLSPDRLCLSVKGMQSRDINMSGAVSVSTRETNLRGGVTRLIVITGAEGQDIALIPSLCNLNCGRENERIAKALAESAGLEFIPTVPEYLYDRQAKKARRRALREKKAQEESSEEDDEEI